jgi:hypothetical protein
MISWGNASVDDLHGADVRLSAASQPLSADETAEDRLQASIDASPACDAKRPAPSTVPVDDQTGTVVINGCSTATTFNGGISPRGYVYAVVLVVDARVYEFVLDGNVDAQYLGAILASVTLDPAGAVDPSPSP